MRPAARFSASSTISRATLLSSRIGSKRYVGGVVGSTMIWIWPSRSARSIAAGGTSRTSMFGAASSACRTAPASGPAPRPTITGRSAVEGNASASATEITIGNRKVQNSASGSRMNSRIRHSVSCTIARSLKERASPEAEPTWFFRAV